MLTKIVTKNYRNLDLEDGVTLGSLNIFVGPNGSGKSNLIKVLKFIQDGLIGAYDTRRGVTRFESAVAAFGSGRILDQSQTPPSVVGIKTYFEWEVGFDNVFDLELNIIDARTVFINQEKFYRCASSDPVAPREYIYRAHDEEKGRVEYRVKNEKQDGFGHFENIPTNQFIADALILAGGDKTLPGELSSWGFYESSQMNIELIRHPRQEIGVIDQVLNPAGENLIPVLSNLFRDHIDFEERMLDAMRELFPKTRRLRVVPEGRTLAIQWFVNGIEEPFYIDQMSTGTIRMLCWATVLLSPKKHKLIVIEEPESDIHPAWLRILAGWIRQAARESQVIISTHSPDLLDYFTDDAESVQVFKRSPKDPKNSVVTRLDLGKLAPRLQEGWQLGDLYRVHDPSVGGWPW